MGFKLIFGFLLIWVHFGDIDGICTLPLSAGTWLSSTRGTWTIDTATSGSSTLSNFKASISAGQTAVNLECVSSIGTLYLLTSTFEIFTDVFATVYTCLDIRSNSGSPNSYTYFIVTASLATTNNEPFTTVESNACINSGYDVAANTHIAILSGSEDAAKIHCPNVILGNYTVIYTASGTTVSGNTLDSCNDTQVLQFTNANATQKLAFTSNNLLNCLYSVESDSKFYVHTYNLNDTTVDGSTTYRFACWVFAFGTDGSTVEGTVSNDECSSTQTQTSVSAPGQTFVFTPLYTCPLNVTTESPAAETSQAWVYVLIALAILLVIGGIFVAVVYFCFISRKETPTKKDEEAAIIKREDTLVVDDIEKEKKKAEEEFKKKDEPEVVKPPLIKPVVEHAKLRMKKEDGYDSGYDDKAGSKWVIPGKGVDDKTPRKGELILREATELDMKDVELKDGHIIKKEDEPKPGPSPMSKGKKIIAPSKAKKEEEKQKEDEKKKAEEEEKQKEEAKKKAEEERKKEEEEKKKKAEEEERKKKEEEDKKKADEERKKEEQGEEATPPSSSRLPESETPKKPPRKKVKPPTTPKPSEDQVYDTLLQRIRKEEKGDKKETKIKDNLKKTRLPPIPSGSKIEEEAEEKKESSEGEYESDESEKQRKLEALEKKKKRLREAEYQPPDDVGDAKVVGKKKRRKHDPRDDLTKNLITRAMQEKMDSSIDKYARSKRMKKLAKAKTKPLEDEEEGMVSGDEAGRKRSSKAKVKDETFVKGKTYGDVSGKRAEHLEKYIAKKYLEGTLDDMHYWDKEEDKDKIDDDASTIVMPLEAPKEGEDKVEEMETDKENKEGLKKGNLDVVLQKDSWDTPAPGQLMDILQGQLPEGFRRDEKGSIIREVDGAVITLDQAERQLALKSKLGQLFKVPRLIRTDQGRPVGGYKDDEYGPTAEWDYGDAAKSDEEDDSAKKRKMSEATVGRDTTTGGKQVAFSAKSGGSSVLEGGEGENKRKYLTSADRELLKQRLFKGQRQEDNGKDKHKPLYQVSNREVRPGSIYIDKFLRGQADKPPLPEVRRTQSMRVAPVAKTDIMLRSDAFDDQRGMTPREGSRARKLDASGVGRRNARVRPWGPGDSFLGQDGIPEEIEPDEEGRPSPPGSRGNGGRREGARSADGAICYRYERHNTLPLREDSNMSDLNMRTVANTPRDGVPEDDRYLRRLLEELYKDKKYFDYYLDTESLPTNAAVETRGLASHGRGFLMDRAHFWADRVPLNPPPPPSQLGMRLSRNTTMYTVADSGRYSMMSDRPHSADGAQPSARSNPVAGPSNAPQFPDTPHVQFGQKSNTGNDSAREATVSFSRQQTFFSSEPSDRTVRGQQQQQQQQQQGKQQEGQQQTPKKPPPVPRLRLASGSADGENENASVSRQLTFVSLDNT